MKAKFLLTILLTLAGYRINAQITFQKTYGATNNYETGRAAQQTADGGFVIAGITYNLTDSKTRVYLVKTDANGTLQWTRTFGDTITQYAYSVQQTNDNGFIIAGKIYNAAGNSDVYLLKTDSTGILQWSKTFGGTGDDFGYSVLQAADGGFVISGNTNSFGAGSDDVYLIKTDSSGILQWTKTFGGAQSDISSSVQQTGEGGFIISGGTMSFGAGGQDVYLIKTDASGNLQWTKTYGGFINDGSYSAMQINGGGYIIIGGANSFGAGDADFYLLKTDSVGTMQWTKTFGGTQFEAGYSVQQTNDEGFIITGNSLFMSPYDAYLIKTDSNGILQWSKIFAGTNGASLFSVKQTNDGGFISTGSFLDHLFLIKTDSSGNSGCTDSIPNILVSSGGTQGTGGVQGTGGIANSPATQTGSGGVETNLCSTVGINKISEGHFITIFPNPFSTQTTLQTTNFLKNATLNVVNCFGQTVKQIKNISGQTVMLSRDNLPSGVYFVRLTEENKIIAVGKLVITDN